MRRRARDTRDESFLARRTAASTGVQPPTGGAWRNITFDTLVFDQTDGKVLYVPNTSFVLQAREPSVWHISVAVFFSVAPAVNDQLGVGVQHSRHGTIGLSIFLAPNTTAGAFVSAGSISLPFLPGDTLTPIAYSANATDNNVGGSNLTACSGVRVA